MIVVTNYLRLLTLLVLVLIRFTSGQKVLLQTANVPIRMVDGTTIMARVLLDSASHRTFHWKKSQISWSKKLQEM